MIHIFEAYRDSDNSIVVSYHHENTTCELTIQPETWHKHLPKCEFSLISGEIDKYMVLHAVILQFDGTCRYITADLNDCFQEAIHERI